MVVIKVLVLFLLAVCGFMIGRIIKAAKAGKTYREWCDEED